MASSFTDSFFVSLRFFCFIFAESEADRSFSEKKPRVLGDIGPSVVELSGYNFKRKEFDIEYDNDAEHLLADMEFKDTDSEADHELKLRILRIYSKRCNKTTLLFRYSGYFATQNLVILV